MLLELIKELRNRTGAGFLDCKKALESSQNNLEKAIILLKKHGTIKAAKKANAVATEGVVQTASNDFNTVIFELNSQTDFVAKNNKFKNLAKKIIEILLKNDFKTVEDAINLEANNQTINDLITTAISKIGEKIVLRRVEKIINDDKVIGSYTHVNNKIAVIVIADGGDVKIVRNIAMHVAAMNPQFLNEDDIPKAKLDKIKKKIANDKIFKNKPDIIKEKIVNGMLKKHLSELTLINQEFVMEKISVGDYLNKNGAKVIRMIRYQLGEEIKIKKTDI